MECSNVDKVGDREVKGSVSKIPTVCGDGDGAETKTEETVSYNIPQTPRELPFYCDYFALGRLLYDFKQYKTTRQRLPWDCHILSDANFAHAFYDLDIKLFRETDVERALGILPGILPDFARSFTYGIGESYKKVTTQLYCNAPRSFRANTNKLIRLCLTKSEKSYGHLKGWKDTSKKCYDLFEPLHEKDKDGAYKDEVSISYLTQVFFEILARIKRLSPDFNTFGFVHSLGEYLSMVCIGDVLESLHAYYFTSALNKLKKHQAGNTVLWHVGLAPKPKNPNYVGLRFGHLTVEAQAMKLTRQEGKRLVSREAVMCRCDCGAKLRVAVTDLLTGKAISCGGCGRHRTMTKATVKRWASATLKNCRDNATARACRHRYAFASPEEVMYFTGIRLPGYDLSRIDDHLDPRHHGEAPYAPGCVFWEHPSQNRAVETKSLTTSSQLNQQVMLEELPKIDQETDEIDPFTGQPCVKQNQEFDDLL